MLELSAAPLGERLRPAAAYITITIPVSDVERAIAAADGHAREHIDATVRVTAPDGSVLCDAAVTADGQPPRPSIATLRPPTT